MWDLRKIRKYYRLFKKNLQGKFKGIQGKFKGIQGKLTRTKALPA